MKPPTIEDISQATADVYGVEPSFILQDTNKKEVVKLRHITQYLCRRFTEYTLENIAAMVEGRTNHATVIHACKKIAFEKERYNDTTYLVNSIIKKLDERGFAVGKDIIRATDVEWYKGGMNYKTE